jgi:hypothetical protein
MKTFEKYKIQTIKEKMKDWNILLDNYSHSERIKILKFENLTEKDFENFYFNKKRNINETLNQIKYYNKIKKEFNEIYLMPRADIYRYVINKIGNEMNVKEIIKITDKILYEEFNK